MIASINKKIKYNYFLYFYIETYIIFHSFNYLTFFKFFKIFKYNIIKSDINKN